MGRNLWLECIRKTLEEEPSHRLSVNKVRKRCTHDLWQEMDRVPTREVLNAHFDSQFERFRAKGYLVLEGKYVTTAPKQPRKQRQQRAGLQKEKIEVGEQAAWREDDKRQDVKHGRFSEDEKETLRQAAQDFASQHGLSGDDLSWLFSTRGLEHGSKARGAWQAIAAALPHRKYKAVYSAGTRMLHEGNYQGKWTLEDEARLLELVQEKGRRWKDIGAALNRLPEGCRDKHKEISLGQAKKKGAWSAEETSALRAAVHGYLARRIAAEDEDQEDAATLSLEDVCQQAQQAEGPQGSRAVLDDIDWNIISRTLGTRSPLQCMDKWYDQVSPSMVATGQWGSGDDRRLLQALIRAGPPTHDYQVDWGQMVRGRSAVICRRRWTMMKKCLPQNWNMNFGQQAKEMARVYAPGLLAEEAPATGQ
ncbi:hypothetical protein WJX73_004975 [Symbiochloris irregularis]|uniref:Uncharacterized protein n=1 Tax=Symbiochloris irregularis TaxID=706552 RepID=A0AAW1PDY4_9CHLO